MIPGITVVTPTIPPRVKMLRRATASVDAASNLMNELYPETPVELITVTDYSRRGAAYTRHIGLTDVTTEWVAFLDDDDEMHADHLTALYGSALEHNADYLWSRFQIIMPRGAWHECPPPRCSNINMPHRMVDSRKVEHFITEMHAYQGPQFLGDKAFSQWDDNDPCQTTITTLVRTELARQAGGFLQFKDDGQTVDGNRRGEDHEFTMRCRAAGGVFRHVPRVTWDWHHHGSNTSGMPTW